MSIRVLASTACLPLLALASCADSAPIDECCACLAGKAPDGSDAAGDDANCFTADEDEDGTDAEQCTTQLTPILYIDADNAFSVELSDDYCRLTCQSACADVDAEVAFNTPQISAGTFTLDVAGTSYEATFVTAGVVIEGDTFNVGMNVETEPGLWHVTIGGITGPGSYPIVDFSETEFGGPFQGGFGEGISGAYEVTSIDEHRLVGTVSAMLDNTTGDVDDDVAVTGSYDVDFQKNDGDTAGMSGLVE